VTPQAPSTTASYSCGERSRSSASASSDGVPMSASYSRSPREGRRVPWPGSCFTRSPNPVPGQVKARDRGFGQSAPATALARSRQALAHESGTPEAAHRRTTANGDLSGHLGPTIGLMPISLSPAVVKNDHAIR
jgi:hypothetical protein